MSELKNKIKNLEKGKNLHFKYNEKIYEIRCYMIFEDGEQCLAINELNDKLIDESMNVESITDKYISLYSFDMMNQKTKYKININKIEII